MSNRKWIKMYIAGTMLQMLLVCIIIAVLRMYPITYSPIWNIIFLIIGGTSSALWGIIVSVLSKNVYSVRTVVKDFFKLKQRIAHYALVLIFATIIFTPVLIVGGFSEGIKWYTFFLLFAQAIIFGGIEEIGWRYTFQPLVEKKFLLKLLALSRSYVGAHGTICFFTDYTGRLFANSFCD